GSTCFLVGPFPGYVQVVGDSADAVTFFVGSILFTLGGGVQSRLAWGERRTPDGGRAAWWSALVQSAGTLFFTVTTYQAMHVALTSLLPRLRARYAAQRPSLEDASPARDPQARARARIRAPALRRR